MPKIYATVTWGEVDSDVEVENLPDAIVKAKKLYSEDADNNIAQMCELIQPFVTSQLIAENFDEWQEYFDDSDFGEFDARKVNVVGVNFGESTLPAIKAESWIDVRLKDGKMKEDVEAWLEESGDTLDLGVIFGWDFGEDSDEDLTMAEHRGQEAIWIEE